MFPAEPEEQQTEQVTVAPQLPKHQLKILQRAEHSVSRKKISKNALKVLYRLYGADYEAYLVGGGVRDILLGLSPKDFDIATSATPEQVSKQFRNCRLIGRRFRLAHILFGREIIEVATFRASHENSSSQDAKLSEQGVLVRDNVYGNLEEDAFRRDFTINALYYSAKDFTVLDHVGGLKDLEARQLRLIGDPVARYREDPVRILRAIRLSCKLDLRIEKSTKAPIPKLAEMLEHVSPARLWDESHKLLLAGHALDTWRAMRGYKVALHIFKQTCASLRNDESGKFNQFVESALANTDKRIHQELPVTPAFLFAVFLWRPQQVLAKKLSNKGLAPYEASQKAASKVIEKQRETIAIPKRFSLVVKEIWALQFQLVNLRKRSVERVSQHPRFRAAYDFLCLRAGDNQELKQLAQWWTDYQEVSPEIRNIMVKKLGAPQQGKKGRSKKRPNRQRNKPRTRVDHDKH
ncbi:polynucleotide adenylyltransferase PcnB [Aliikangiella marina]|uniref:Poly(A) polymerase I n=2 Tax=Aliikangiella marina TaxID=1712262 RepID=A0A545TEG5_9GAMM|nr:polynucleotide adenylyltransferase PcnB [Aliikangiella marina]